MLKSLLMIGIGVGCLMTGLHYHHSREIASLQRDYENLSGRAAEIAGELAKSSQSATGGAQGLPFIGGNPQMRQSPAVNIMELTEQVMRQIDSQIVARKERMGKPF